jgi:hypothetical protein
MKMRHLYDIQIAVERTAGCEAMHVESRPVLEMFHGGTVWDGVVEIFNLIGHPDAKRAYGWTYQDGKETHRVVILDIPPVNSPNTAVRAFIAARAQKSPPSACGAKCIDAREMVPSR